MKRTAIRLFRVVLATALASPFILAPAPAPAECAPPSIHISRGFVTAGKIVVVRGEAWDAGACSDESGGCFDGGEAPSEPMTNISVTLERGGRPIQETTVQGPSFRVKILTEGLTPGIFEIVAEWESTRVGQELTVAAPD